MGSLITPTYLESEKRTTSPSSPVSGEGIIYPKSDGVWYSKNSSGVERRLDGFATIQDFQSGVSVANASKIILPYGQMQSVSTYKKAIRQHPSPTLRYSEAIQPNSNTIVLQPNEPSGTITGPTTVAIKNGRLQSQFTTAASLNANVNMSYSGGRPHKPNSNYLTYFCCRISTAGVITSMRFTIGLSTTTPITSDAPGSTVAAMIRYSTAVPDGGWVGVLVKSDGTVGATASLGSVAIDTDYVFEIFVRGSTTYFALNYGTPVSLSSPNISGETVLGTPQVTLQTLDTNAKTMYVSGILISDYEL